MRRLRLDDVEASALTEFLRILGEQEFSPKPAVLEDRIHRTVEGHIVVPVALPGSKSSLSMALLMGHKADQLYKQTSCRFVLAQCPAGDPEHVMYVWKDRDWHPIP